MDNAAIAEAFSRHRFAETYPRISDDVVWTVVGAQRLDGKAAVVAACDESAGHLKDVTTTFRFVNVVDGGDTVVVDTESEYVDADGSTVVASCDLYSFTAGALTGIRSYTLALEA